MNFPQILGQIQGAADGALSIIGAVTGQAESHPIGDQVVAVHVPTQEARQQLAAVVDGLIPGGDKREAMAKLYPHLDAKSLDLALQLADDLSAALANNGVVDWHERYEIGKNCLKRML